MRLDFPGHCAASIASHIVLPLSTKFPESSQTEAGLEPCPMTMRIKWREDRA